MANSQSPTLATCTLTSMWKNDSAQSSCAQTSNGMDINRMLRRPILSTTENATIVKIKLVPAMKQLTAVLLLYPTILKIVPEKYISELIPTSCCAAWRPHPMISARWLAGVLNSSMELFLRRSRTLDPGMHELSWWISAMLASISSGGHPRYTLWSTCWARWWSPLEIRYRGVSGRNTNATSWITDGTSEIPMTALQPPWQLLRAAPMP
ncbi:hypothetical protein OGAPHI_006718 [Ogataea philodendri]|uniref:Uncharacterized protein n=1 Tax=Ogataea philodendri TaxID=1378263 RepID=A0A9P8T158_9ASCO|nr:uncharacterized protein OGAPHI_006718 [Ogataea philodendri]KAH3661311.1 hypothetical protein OGAPHI_006718 [Ogataea philodendri]